LKAVKFTGQSLQGTHPSAQLRVAAMDRTALVRIIAVPARIMAALLNGWTDDIRTPAHAKMASYDGRPMRTSLRHGIGTAKKAE
jgi:hypothetical protein